MSSGRLRKGIIFGNLDDVMWRGRDGKQKKWDDWGQNNVRAFGIAGNWKVTALGAEVLVEKVPESGRKCKVAWEKEDIDATGHRRDKREAITLEMLLSYNEV